MSEIKTRTYVDEDWKAQVQREKEQARLKNQGGAVAPQEPAPVESQQAQAPEEAPGNPLFEGLVNMLATQAMYCLGFINAPGQPQAVVNLDQAKEAIEMVRMLREKTQGNLSAGEEGMIAETLSELQRLFAARVQQAQAQTMQQAGVDMNNLKGEAPQ